MRNSKKLPWILLLPAASLSFWIARAFPETTETLYANTIYPAIARGFAAMNPFAFSLAEPLALAGMVLSLWGLYRYATHGSRRVLRVLFALWASAGILASVFLLLWGYNYARPSLEARMGLEAPEDATIDARSVLDAGRRAAIRTTAVFAALDTAETPTTLPFRLDELGHILDDAYERLRLPGDVVRFSPTPAKPLRSSVLFSYLGISGIFVPFTGEPSVNALQPDVSLPLVVAHEKAHQRGITNEGEANFAAFLVCAQESSPLYLRYAAYLFATRYLLSEASFYLPAEEVRAAGEQLGEGPRADVRAIREFWRRYEGPAATVATSVNDRYLRTMQVPGGVESYGTVVRLLMALEREGELIRE